MPNTFWYGPHQVPDFATLVAQPFDLKSPNRSTAPLLAYWLHSEHQLGQFRRALNFEGDALSDTAFRFEHEFHPPAGQGRASHTDLMIEVPNLVIAVEAKYTEPAYESVRRWLGEPPPENHRTVLNGWLSTINDATGAALSIECVMNATYQMIHRTASACSRDARRRVVLYHCFDPSRSMLKYYQRQLSALATLINNPQQITFVLLVSTMELTLRYMQLQADWHRRPRPDLSDAVRAAILGDAVATFEDMVAFRF